MIIILRNDGQSLISKLVLFADMDLSNIEVIVIRGERWGLIFKDVLKEGSFSRAYRERQRREYLERLVPCSVP